MKQLPNSELEIIMIIWEYNRPITRMEIEEKLEKRGRHLDKTSVLAYLKRLEKRGFVEISKEGKNNIFTSIITEQDYMKNESKRILKEMYHNSLKNFVCALYDGEGLNDKELEELQEYIDQKIRK